MFKTASLTEEVKHIICYKGTEYPGSGEYNNFDHGGTYICRQCGVALFRSEHKFHSGCGWPSFDQDIPGRVTRVPDADGRRTEIVCSRCNAHLGHVFIGEGYTILNTRHCVNSLSLEYVNDMSVDYTSEAILAAGCFWGVEYYLQKLNGVLKTEVGYTGGKTINPTYKEVCTNNTGHLEAVRVLFDPTKLSYEDLLKYFFEIHDPTQKDGQGPDLGNQYLSAIFYYDNEQYEIIRKVYTLLEAMGYVLATSIYPVTTFYKAEELHQNYYNKKGELPYCHSWRKIF